MKGIYTRHPLMNFEQNYLLVITKWKIDIEVVRNGSGHVPARMDEFLKGLLGFALPNLTY